MKIHAIQTGRVRIKKSQIVGHGAGLLRRAQPILNTEWADWAPTYAWAIAREDGVVVVDTGSAAHLKSLPGWHPYFRYAVQFDIEPEQELGPQLRTLGIAPKDVRKTVLTHFHIDHDAGLHHVPDGCFVSRGELKAASGASGHVMGYLPQRRPRDFNPQTLEFQNVQFGPFDQISDITADGQVFAVPTPGHTANHLSVVVLDGDTVIFIAGDASYTEETMLQGQVDGVSPSEDLAQQTLAKIRTLATTRPVIYLPTHDPLSAYRLANRQTVVPVAAYTIATP